MSHYARKEKTVCLDYNLKSITPLKNISRAKGIQRLNFQKEEPEAQGVNFLTQCKIEVEQA